MLIVMFLISSYGNRYVLVKLHPKYKIRHMIQERTTLMTVKQFFCYSKIFSSFPYRFMLKSVK